MANLTVLMGLFAVALVSGVVCRPIARKATVNPKSPSSCETDNHFAVSSSGAGGGVDGDRRPTRASEKSCPRAGGMWNGSGYGTGSSVVVVPVSTPPPKRAMEYWNAIGGVDSLLVPPPYRAME